MGIVFYTYFCTISSFNDILGEFTYEYMCNAEEYIQSLLSIGSIHDEIANNLAALERILSKRSCEVDFTFLKVIYNI